MLGINLEVHGGVE